MKRTIVVLLLSMVFAGAGLAQTRTTETRKTVEKKAGDTTATESVIISQSEDITRREVAERTALILRSALHEGVVKGGGVALLDCRAALESFSKTILDEDERAGFRALTKALDAPARVILKNSVFDPSSLLTQLGHGRGLDARTGNIVDMQFAGILDSAASVRGALITAVRGAALALTVDVVIHKRNPQASVNP